MLLQAEQWNADHQILDNIINNLPHYIFWKDKDLKFRGSNMYFAQQFGFKDPNELIGKTDIDFPWFGAEMGKYIEDDKKIITTGKSKLNYEEVQRQPDGSEKVVLVSKVPLFDKQGKVSGLLGIYTDITERKKMELALKAAKETAEAASAAKTEFIRNMSHDLRTPLTGIIGMADMIGHMPETMSVHEGTQDIRQAGVALLNLLNEIIETSQLESGDIKHEKACFTLKATIDALTEIFTPAIKQKGLTLETYYDDDIPEILFGQELLLHRIILNLLGNAVKFTTHGAISLEVSLSQKKSDKVSLKIVVKDTGAGIPADKQEIIFDKFSRLTPSYSNNFKGSGLGLYMVKEFIKKLGGDIKVTSTLGNGAQFTCSVQFKIPTNAQLKKYHKLKGNDAEKSAHSMKYELDKIAKKTNPIQSLKEPNKTIFPEISEKLRALLVEDNVLPRKIAETLLTQEGYEVVTAETASDAIKKSTQTPFDLIYMDVGLPDGTGIDVTRAIRNDPKNPNINTFIVALTAHADPEIRKECLNAGVQEIFDKPLNPNKIEAAEAHMNKLLFSKKKDDYDGPAKNTPQEISKLPLLDLTVSIQMMGGNKALTKEMLDLFMKQLPEFQSSISEAFHKEDWSMLTFHVHKLHGGLCYTGAIHLKAITHNFEVALNKNTGDYADYYDQLMQGIRDTEEEYKKNKDLVL